MCSTVFFKHKYLTLPTMTTSDTLLLAADNLMDAIKSITPCPNITTNAINQLIAIFKMQAATTKMSDTAQRVMREGARVERVHTP